MYQREVARNAAREEASRGADPANVNVSADTNFSTVSITEPRYLQTMRNLVQTTRREWDQWGFVIVRSAALDDEQNGRHFGRSGIKL